MYIEVTKPELETLIQRCLETGAFADAEDVILHALRCMAASNATGAELVAVVQSSPYKEIDIEPPRDRLPVRDISF